MQQESSPTATILSSATSLLYPKIPEGQLLNYLHNATEIDDDFRSWQDEQILNQPSQEQPEDKYNFPFCSKISTVTTPINWGRKLSQESPLDLLETTIGETSLNSRL